MPISKSGNLYFTNAEYEIAREVKALEYARFKGYPIRQIGHYYTMEDHDSMVFNEKGHWFWNSHKISGGALEFCLYYVQLSLPEAVRELCHYVALTAQQAAPKPQPNPQPNPKAEPEQKAAFVLPPKAASFKRLYGYLIYARRLSPEVVKDMVRRKLVYESVKKTDNGAEYHNACFVSYDNHGQPVGAYQRSLSDQGKIYKLDVVGSDKSFGWLMQGEAGSVCVFEAAIDAASYATFCQKSGVQHGDLLALGGLGDTPLQKYLEGHPETKAINFCLDVDEPGRQATNRLMVAYQRIGYHVCDQSTGNLSHAKDWNGELQWQESQERELEQTEVSLCQN